MKPFHNGVLVHLSSATHGEVVHRILPEYKQQISSDHWHSSATATRCGFGTFGCADCGGDE